MQIEEEASDVLDISKKGNPGGSAEIFRLRKLARESLVGQHCS
jgi:hypothetical protein